MRDLLIGLGIIVLFVVGVAVLTYADDYYTDTHILRVVTVYDEYGQIDGHEILEFEIQDCDICKLKPVANYETMINKGLEKPELIFKAVGISKSFKRSTGERIITHFDLGQGPI